jgi:hypothetical protein
MALGALWVLSADMMVAAHGKQVLFNNHYPRVQREDSRQYIDPTYEEFPRPQVVSKSYKKSSRVPRSPQPPAQDIDAPHLRSCSTCTQCRQEQIEGVPDVPWYIRWFTCCLGRRR